MFILFYYYMPPMHFCVTLAYAHYLRELSTFTLSLTRSLARFCCYFCFFTHRLDELSHLIPSESYTLCHPRMIAVPLAHIPFRRQPSERNIVKLFRIPLFTSLSEHTYMLYNFKVKPLSPPVFFLPFHSPAFLISFSLFPFCFLFDFFPVFLFSCVFAYVCSDRMLLILRLP